MVVSDIHSAELSHIGIAGGSILASRGGSMLGSRELAIFTSPGGYHHHFPHDGSNTL